MMKYCGILLTIILGLTATPVRAQQGDLNHKLDSLVSENAFSGIILLQQENNILFEYAGGLANRDQKQFVSDTTRFELASLTKQFTAALILKLSQDNKLDLDSSFGTYLPSYPFDHADRITIRHLLHHRSGLINYTEADKWPAISTKSFTEETFLKEISKDSLLFTPGSQFSYSNTNYYLLGLIAESIEGKSYEKLLHEYLLQPLKMERTGVLLNRKNITALAHGYEKLPNGYVEEAPQQHYSTALSVSGMYATGADLLTWANALYDNRILNEGGSGLFKLPVEGSYGFGLVASAVDQDDYSQLFGQPFAAITGNDNNLIQEDAIYWHWGSNPGYHTLLVMIPSRNLTLVVLSNISALNSGKETYIFEIADELFKCCGIN